MNDKILELIRRIENSQGYLYRVLSKNDSGSSLSHQEGIYIDKQYWNICFNEKGIRGTNVDRIANLTWYDGKKSPGIRFNYYGKGTRNEYRLTRVGRKFNPGTIIILVKESIDEYYGFALMTDEEVKKFKSAFRV